MTSVTATAARKDIYNLIARVNDDCTPIAITNSKGKGAVLIGEDDWSSIEETLYLLNIPSMAQRLADAHNESIDDCISEDELDW